MLRQIKNSLYLSFIMVLISSCEYFSKEVPQYAIARVGEKYLYKEDIAAIMPVDYTKEDSISISEKYINNWAIKELMLVNAERNINDQEKENFERLVSDYRADLYINFYKEGLINNAIDTVVNQKEMQFFYEKNKEVFKLNETLMKLRYIQVSLNEKKKKINAFEEKLKRFENSDKRELDSLSLHFTSVYLNDSTWVKAESVLKKLPFLEKEMENNRQSFVSHRDSSGIYFVQICDVLRRNEQAPMEYVLPTLQQIILNQRKLEFVKKLETDIINTGIKKKQFEIIYE
ncbi:peptidyl-prolyl cis-trans isomerase [Capnocytophaga cynodegmi]|uniref:peptidyl-prolyl cis-trans isomerase n=1 Tax=Capnocytophaga cynodegmi TaxID=28189 RepID=UPI0021019087|nr:peptidyl-prolyl cis-trans isomerase [Capnocytophaga cynodegmi]